MRESDGEAIKVEDMKPGMMVDLEKDPYADPLGDDPGFPHEFAVIEEVHEETADCTVIDFLGFSVGFPRGHRLFVPRTGTEQPLA